jgi:Tfp pilus assembly protein FimT
LIRPCVRWRTDPRTWCAHPWLPWVGASAEQNRSELNGLDIDMTSTRHHTLALALTALAVAGPTTAFAQSATDTQATAPQSGKTVRGMFAWADKNKDGQLTRSEAKGHLPITHKNFASLDTDKRGWISFEQFADFTNKRVGKNADDILKIGQRL